MVGFGEYHIIWISAQGVKRFRFSRGKYVYVQLGEECQIIRLGFEYQPSLVYTLFLANFSIHMILFRQY